MDIVTIDLEFRKGILFVRLFGLMNDANYLEVEKIMREYIVEKEVKYVVLNLDNMKVKSMHAYNMIIKYNSFIKINHGSLIIVANEIEMPEFLKITFAKNEYQAMNLIAI